MIDRETKGSCQAAYHAISDEDIERIIKFPFTMISYGTFARVLAVYVREKRDIT